MSNMKECNIKLDRVDYGRSKYFLRNNPSIKSNISSDNTSDISQNLTVKSVSSDSINVSGDTSEERFSIKTKEIKFQENMKRKSVTRKQQKTLDRKKLIKQSSREKLDCDIVVSDVMENLNKNEAMKNTAATTVVRRSKRITPTKSHSCCSFRVEKKVAKNDEHSRVMRDLFTTKEIKTGKESRISPSQKAHKVQTTKISRSKKKHKSKKVPKLNSSEANGGQKSNESKVRQKVEKKIAKNTDDSKRTENATRDIVMAKAIETENGGRDNNSNTSSKVEHKLQTKDISESKEKRNTKQVLNLNPSEIDEGRQIKTPEKELNAHNAKPKRKCVKRQVTPLKEKVETESLSSNDDSLQKSSASDLTTNSNGMPDMKKARLETERRKLTSKNNGVKKQNSYKNEQTCKQKQQISKKSPISLQKDAVSEISNIQEPTSNANNELKSELEKNTEMHKYYIVKDIEDIIRCVKNFVFTKEDLKRLMNSCPISEMDQGTNKVAGPTSSTKLSENYAVSEKGPGNALSDKFPKQPDSENEVDSSFEDYFNSNFGTTPSNKTDTESRICKENSYFSDESYHDVDCQPEITIQPGMEILPCNVLEMSANQPEMGIPEHAASESIFNLLLPANNQDILDFQSMITGTSPTTTENILECFPVEENKLETSLEDKNAEMLTNTPKAPSRYLQPNEEIQDEEMEWIDNPKTPLSLNSENLQKPDFKDCSHSTPVSKKSAFGNEYTDENVLKYYFPKTTQCSNFEENFPFPYNNISNIVNKVPDINALTDIPQMSEPEQKEEKTFELDCNTSGSSIPVMKIRSRNRLFRRAQISLERDLIRDERRNITGDIDEVENEQINEVCEEDEKVICNEKSNEQLHSNKSTPEICNFRTTSKKICAVNKVPQEDLQVHEKSIPEVVNEENIVTEIFENKTINGASQKDLQKCKINKERNAISYNLTEITFPQRNTKPNNMVSKTEVQLGKNYPIPIKLKTGENKIGNVPVSEIRIFDGITKSNYTNPASTKPKETNIKTFNLSNNLENSKVVIKNVTSEDNISTDKKNPTIKKLQNQEQKLSNFRNMQEAYSLLMSDDFDDGFKFKDDDEEFSNKKSFLEVTHQNLPLTNDFGVTRNMNPRPTGVLSKMLSPIRADSNETVKFGNSETHSLFDQYFPKKMHKEENNKQVNDFSKLADLSTRHLDVTCNYNSNSDSDAISIDASTINLSSDYEEIDNDMNHTEKTLQQSALSLTKYLNKELKTDNNSAARNRIVFDVLSSQHQSTFAEGRTSEQNTNGNGNNNQEFCASTEKNFNTHFRNYKEAERAQKHTKITFTENSLAKIENLNNDRCVSTDNNSLQRDPMQIGNSNLPAKVPSIVNMDRFDFQLMMQTMPPPPVMHGPKSYTRSGPMLPEYDPEFLEKMRVVEEKPPPDLFANRLPGPQFTMRNFNNGYPRPQRRYFNRKNNNWRGHQGFRGSRPRTDRIRLERPTFEYQGNYPHWHKHNQ